MCRRITIFFVAIAIASLTPKSLAQWNPNFVQGRTTIVHLFEWRWNDIADECERFLGPRGFAGVQTSPVNENAVISSPFRPWWERYQPVSYKLETRSGTSLEFQNMVRRCNNVGVRIYVDAILNHMTGPIGASRGTNGSYFDSDKLQYDEVPYSYLDFTPNDWCKWEKPGEIDYCDAEQVRNCELSGLKDLYGGGAWVQDMQVEFLNRLIGYGVAGFRLDAAKHMWPGDMELILSRLVNLSTSHGFPAGSRPFIFQEVIDLGSEAVRGDHYFHMGRVTEFKYSKGIGEVFKGDGERQTALHYLYNFGPGGEGEGWGFYPSGSAVVFVDNHDNQRGHGAGGKAIVTYHNSKQYKLASAFKLAWNYGITRIMSSFAFDPNTGTDQGPPNVNGVIKPVTLNLDGTCGNDWICEHRWRQIFNMVEFRNVVEGTGVNDWWSNGEGGNQIAFCRGDKGFIVFNTEPFDLTRTFQTCLPPGTYCDVISGSAGSVACTSKSVVVGAGGWADIHISSSDPDPVIAIHRNSSIPRV